MAGRPLLPTCLSAWHGAKSRGGNGEAIEIRREEGTDDGGEGYGVCQQRRRKQSRWGEGEETNRGQTTMHAMSWEVAR